MENAGTKYNSSWTYIIVTTVVLVLIQVVFYMWDLFKKKNTKKDTNAAKNEAPLNVKEKSTAAQAPAIKSSKKKPSNTWKGKGTFTHPYLATNLMGHTKKVLGFDCTSDGKYLVSCAEDRSIFFWDLRDICGKGKKSVRINVEYDHATYVAWSPDGKAYIIHKGIENCIEVFKIEKKKDGLPATTSKAITFDKIHVEDTVGFGIALNGRFMMSCSTKNDMIIWSLKGEQLAKVDTYLMTTMKAKISPCGRYVVASGFVGDIKVWDVQFTKNGEFKEVVRAFELSGHSSGVYDFAFGAGTSHIATVSKDGTWKLFDTNINYIRGEKIQLLNTGKYSQGSSPSLIALSPKADIVIIATGSYLEIFNAATGVLSETIENVFSDDITCIEFDPMGKYLFVAGDRTIRVFQDVKL